jgi:hypothetical protein
LTIPTSDPELWSKLTAMLQPIAGPLLIFSLIGELNLTVLGMPILVLIFLCGIPASVAIYLLT